MFMSLLYSSPIINQNGLWAHQLVEITKLNIHLQKVYIILKQNTNFTDIHWLVKFHNTAGYNW